MIDFRYHLVSIIAVFLALAVGIVLGSGPLKDPIDDTLTGQAEQLRQDREDLRADLNAQQQALDHATAVFTELQAAVLAGTLSGHRVVLVSAPDVEESWAQGAADAVRAAGGQLSGTVGLTARWLEGEQADELAALIAGLEPADTVVPPDATPAQRANAVLAAALLDPTAAAAEPNPDSDSLLTALDDRDFVSVDGDPAVVADLAVVLAAPPAADDGALDPTLGTQVDLVAALDRAGAGTVVAGNVAAAQNGGLLAAVRDAAATSGTVSTVDSLGSPPGPLALALVLGAEADGDTGAYGYGPDADAPVPSPPPPSVGTAAAEVR